MESIWWTHLARANSFLKRIVQTLAEENSLVLTLPEELPWRDDFMEIIRDELAMENDSRGLDVCVCPEENPGEFLMNRYCSEEKRATYRYGLSYAEFLGRSREILMNRRTIWITGVTGAHYAEWLDFIEGYLDAAGRRPAAVFVLETSDTDLAGQRGKKNIRKLAYGQNVGSYDCFAFCALTAAETSCQDRLRPYLAELAATLCGQDVELAAECVSDWRRFLEEPAETIRRITEELPRSDGMPFEYSGTDQDIRNRIWTTQIKTVFPVIEQYRSSFVEKYYRQIGEAMEHLPTYDFQDEIVERPEDLEIGQLHRLAVNELSRTCGVDERELYRYRKARNDLAHLDVIDLDTVDMILKQGGRVL